MTDKETLKPGQVVGVNLRRIREGRGFSQRRLVGRMRALRFSWHQTTVQGVEKGTRPVSIDELFALAVCLDTDAASLLDPAPTGVVNIDVGFPWRLPPRFFRLLIPVSDQQGMEPRHVASAAEWRDDKPVGGLQIEYEVPAGEDELQARLKNMERQLQELKEVALSRRTES